jgi:hypothetical protein
MLAPGWSSKGRLHHAGTSAELHHMPLRQLRALRAASRRSRQPSHTAYLLPWWRATLGTGALTLLLHPQLILLKLLFLVIV